MRTLFTMSAVATLAFSVGAWAEPIYGVSDASSSQALFMFDSANAAGSTVIGTITGLAADQVIRDIDFRPADGLLYAITTTADFPTSARLYTIDLGTGAATAVGTGFTLTGNTSSRFSVDFNPVVDRLRVVTGDGHNYRVNPIDGTLVAQDTSLSAGTDTPQMSGIAYSNSFAGATQTTLYGYDYFTDTVGTIGGLNGAPNSPNGGLYTAIGGSGVVTFSAAAGMDISGATGMAYFAADDNDSPTAASELFSINLGTGALTRVGNLPVAAIGISVMTPVPEPASWGLMVLGLGAMGGFAARRRRVG
ncbi:DUF4394 domain-containing protein [Aquincola sp. MAHUQ-54]|uniref:DUF4394 domain-containing protein n=2 Tax=Sphaerotilaceae TaxID=2975441 RepID=A0AAW9QGP4_9BURK